MNKYLKLPKRSVTMDRKQGFRDGTVVPCLTVNYVLNAGGVGDFLNWLPAFEYIADNLTYVHGIIWSPPFFLDMAKLFCKRYPNWQAMSDKNFDNEVPLHTSIVAPDNELHTTVGAHLLDIGFRWYLNFDPTPPLYNRVTPFHFDKRLRWELRDALDGLCYAVMTPGATTDARSMPAKAFNEIARYLKAKGLTPVFLGKRELEREYKANFNDEMDFSLGLDLREKTSLPEAAQIMQDAALVVGIDNGLLHLASTTPVPLVFGYNITTVAHRRPRRKFGETYDVFVTEAELECIGCQSRTRPFNLHSFKFCMYEDYLCLEKLFDNDCARWKRAIDKAIEGRDGR